MRNAQSIIKIPETLATELDKLAGHKRRSAYATDVLWRVVRRNKRREALKLSKWAWKLAGCGRVYTFNVKSFRGLAPKELEGKIAAP